MRAWRVTSERLIRCLPLASTLTDCDVIQNHRYGDAWKHDLDCCNATVLTAVKRALDAEDIPIHWIQMDDWWYKGYLPSGGGVYCTMDWQPWSVKAALSCVCAAPVPLAEPVSVCPECSSAHHTHPPVRMSTHPPIRTCVARLQPRRS